MNKVKYSPTLIQDWFENQIDIGIELDFSKEQIEMKFRTNDDSDRTSLHIQQYARTNEGLSDLLVQLKSSGMNVPEFDTFVVPVIEKPEVVLVTDLNVDAVLNEEHTSNQQASEQPTSEEPAPVEQQVPDEEVSSKWKYLKWGGGIAIGALAVYLVVKALGPETVAEATGKLLS